MRIYNLEKTAMHISMGLGPEIVFMQNITLGTVNLRLKLPKIIENSKPLVNF